MRLVGSLGSVDDGSPAAEGTGLTIAGFWTVVKKTELYLLYSAASLDAAGAQDPSVFAIGAIHKFGFGG